MRSSVAPRRQLGDIIIRPLRAEDAPSLHVAVRGSIESLGRWLPWCHPGYSLVDAETWVAHCTAAWEDRSEFAFGVFDCGSGELLGGVGLNQVDHARASANLGYWVGERHRGRGVATRAAALAAAMGFEELGLARIEIVALSQNFASQRVAEKIGAIREGETLDRLVLHGRAAPAVVYVLTPPPAPPSGRM